MRSLALSALLVFALSACESASSERIEAWKGTQKGPEKIEAALRSGNVPASLRAEAAAALVDMGRPEKVDEIMASLEAGERSEILKTLIDIEIKGMSSPQVPKAREARDTLFSVRQYAPPRSRSGSTASCWALSKRIFRRGALLAVAIRWRKCSPRSVRPQDRCWSSCSRIRRRRTR